MAECHCGHALPPMGRCVSEVTAPCVQELERLHRREITHLDMFVGNKALAGKCAEFPYATFRRSRCIPDLLELT
jgi:hypothetical protein